MPDVQLAPGRAFANLSGGRTLFPGQTATVALDDTNQQLVAAGVLVVTDPAAAGPSLPGEFAFRLGLSSAAVGNLAAAGEVVGPIDVRGMGSLGVEAVAAATASLTFVVEVSYDGPGGPWRTLQGARPDTGAIVTGGVVVSGTGSFPVEYGLPPHAAAARVRCSLRTSGQVAVRAQASSQQVEPVVAIGNTPLQVAGLNPSANKIGFVGAEGIWSTHTTTAVATYTSTGMDLAGVASSSAPVATTRLGGFRAMAWADQAFTLALEVSVDDTTYRRVKQVASASPAAGANYAELIQPPIARYARLVVAATGTTPTALLVASARMAA